MYSNKSLFEASTLLQFMCQSFFCWSRWFDLEVAASAEQLDDLSGSECPLLDGLVLWCLPRLFNQGRGLLHRGVFGDPLEALQVLQQH